MRRRRHTNRRMGHRTKGEASTLSIFGHQRRPPSKGRKETLELPDWTYIVVQPTHTHDNVHLYLFVNYIALSSISCFLIPKGGRKERYLSLMRNNMNWATLKLGWVYLSVVLGADQENQHNLCSCILPQTADIWGTLSWSLHTAFTMISISQSVTKLLISSPRSLKPYWQLK